MPQSNPRSRKTGETWGTLNLDHPTAFFSVVLDSNGVDVTGLPPPRCYDYQFVASVLTLNLPARVKKG
jgi:hypothetical protein